MAMGWLDGNGIFKNFGFCRWKNIFEVEESVRGFIEFWTNSSSGLLSLAAFSDYKRLERIFNSKNWSSTYHLEPSLTSDLKWLHKKVVYGLMNLRGVDFDAISERNFVTEMKKWLRTVAVYKTVPELNLCST